ncbi:DUF2145 domain-containing protein [Chitinibacter fontanus]|uniref:DUF2145 domain-containing protein n=1 Tax=Chitinibacter fontanus TaxID=1737446 RepID=A0A7D5Z989_9NEIS|nr:DUF2145 domain-containing protein [Chitinibacter fontanus]QLI82482.1 DUF2145 domain-containing protein [Chitinibacter fontanus]
MRQITRSFCLALALIASSSAWAGRTCEDKAPDPEVFRKAMAAGYANMQQLDTIKPKVALIARVGQDLSEYKLRYSHLGYVWQDPSQNQQWRVVHLLNECGTANSDLWREGLANFFMDDPFTYDSLIIVPSSAVQERLYTLLQNRSQLEQMHGSSYNMVAYPFSTLHQNSNQWALETLARAMSKDIELRNREQAQQWLKLAGFDGTELKINTFKRLGGRMFRANIAFDDHPTDQRMAGKIKTITVDSIVNFITQNNPGARYYPVDAKPLPKLN